MKRKRYDQFCALAQALDVVGERWTLLVIRELLTGPRRYKDLVHGLPGISTNLLTARLKRLARQGLLCRRVLPPPAGCAVYELTPIGQTLEESMLALGCWGSQWLPPASKGQALPSVGALALALKAFFHRERAAGVDATYELHLGQEVLQVRVTGGDIQVRQGAPAKPEAVFHTDTKAFLGVFTGHIPAEEAIASGLVRIEGDPGALSRFLTWCGLPGSHRWESPRRRAAQRQ